MAERTLQSRMRAALLPGAVLGASIAVLVIAERRRPLRASTHPESRRILRNLVLGAASMSVAAFLEQPVVRPLARKSLQRRRGLAQLPRLPEWGRDLLAILAMDYTIYLWHVATHRVAFLWRFHLVHHLDRDLDTTTALRFHFAEIALSIPYRALQIVMIGTSERALTAWQRFFFLSVLFHHSNLRLPRRLEQGLALFLTTPRMHGIHHSVLPDETNSNWSSGFSFWDRLHGTLRLDVEQSDIEIGPPGRIAAGERKISNSLMLPFRPSGDFRCAN